MTETVNPLDGFIRSIKDYYRTEARRSDACLGDVVNILTAGVSADAKIDAILSRIESHYRRDDQR